MRASPATGLVMELQGLYGPFQFPELLLQKIWAERAFCAASAVTASGETVKVEVVGRWNRQGGPDFQGARLCIGGRWQHGDVELHLREEDWRAHRHAEDPAYDQVILHVVLFPPKRTVSRGAGGREIPVLPLLPLLWHDLEEYAADAAVSAIAARPADRLAEAWLGLDAVALERRVADHSRRRWQAKVRYARIRVERMGWEAACHHTALEILGYRFNRAQMLEVASRWPLEMWSEPTFRPEAAYQQLHDRWSLAGVRPANHPRRRLLAYAEWNRALPRAAGGSWPVRLERMAKDWPGAVDGADASAPDVRCWRATAGWSDWRQRVMTEIGAAAAVPRPRADNIWGDGLLPLLATRETGADDRLYAWWFHGWPGDQPASIVKAARLIGLTDGSNRRPLAWGHVQALLGWQHALETEAAGGLLRRT